MAHFVALTSIRSFAVDSKIGEASQVHLVLVQEGSSARLQNWQGMMGTHTCCWSRKAAQAARAAREAAKDAQNQLEIEAGAPGLFAFINTRLGTGATSSTAPDQGGQQRGAPSGRWAGLPYP